MKNKDRPINPAFTVKSKEGDVELSPEEAVARGRYDHGNIGLTKREYFAGLAMQSMAGIECSESDSHMIDIAERIAKRAVKFADELLEALEEKTNQDGGDNS